MESPPPDILLFPEDCLGILLFPLKSPGEPCSSSATCPRGFASAVAMRRRTTWRRFLTYIMENNLVAFFFLGLSRLVEEDSLAVLGTTALRRIGGHRECRLREGLSAHLGVNHVNLSNQITRCFVLFSTTYRLTRRLPHLLHAANKHTLLLWTSSSSDNWTACAATIDLLRPSR